MKLRSFFYQSSISAFYNYHEYRLKKFIRGIAKEVSPEETVLDVGAGDCQYKKYFEKRCHYKSQDICDKDAHYQYDRIDIRSEIYSIPLPDESNDRILCTQVFEHLKYPEKAIRELQRLLKKNGTLYLTVPLCSDEHEVPYDYFRYTQYGLKNLAEEAGFRVISIMPQGGRFICLGKNIKDLIPLLFDNSIVQKTLYVLQLPIILPILFILFFLDYFDIKKRLTLNYECIFQKI